MGDLLFGRDVQETSNLLKHRNDGILSDAKAVVTLGMHRSGTSAMARALSLSGLSLPSNLMPSADDNPEGFWESRPIVEFNDALLDQLGLHWDSPFAYSVKPRGASLLKPRLREAVHLIGREFQSDLPIMLKDPRISLLAPFWDNALRQAGYDPRYIIMVRHPLEVARSLMERNRIPREKALLVWLSYNFAAERDTRGMRRSFVRYDRLLTDSQSVLDQLEGDLEITLDRRDPDSQLRIEQSLKQGLRHHNETGLSDRQAKLPSWADHVYRQLIDPEFERFSEDDTFLKSILREYSVQRSFFGPIVADYSRRLHDLEAASKETVEKLDQKIHDTAKAYEEQLSVRTGELQNERSYISQLKGEIEKLETQLVDRSEKYEAEISKRVLELDAERAKVFDLQSQIERRTRDVSSAYEREIDAKTAELKAEREHFKTLKSAFDEKSRHVGLLEEQLAELRRSHAEEIEKFKARLDFSATDLQTRLSDQNEQLIELREELEKQRAREESFRVELEDERAHALSVINSLEEDLKREQMVSRERHRTLVGLSSDLQEIQNSTTWRASIVIRKAGIALPWIAKAIRYALRPSTRGSSQPKGGATARNWVQPSQLPPRQPTSHPARAHQLTHVVSAWNALDPAPIADFLTLRDGDEEGANSFREHVARFPLPYHPDDEDKPKLELTDDEARAWVDRVAEMSKRARPYTGQPDVSIIVPVHNQLPFTLSTLASVYTQKSGYSFEIILADDASTDQTQSLQASDFRNFKVVRAEENLGFLGNVNSAAKTAEGRVIVLLNNDTIALPGWLENLISTLDEDESIGMVGSQLIFPSGRLQEAGGIVWRDGSAWNYGRNEDPMDPRFSFARDVDYCSGASIAISRDLWQELDGFDAVTYEKAYYEDTDLAFRVREAGYRVRYQPQSALIHFEGASSGMDLTTGQKQYQVSNQKRFINRWKRVLMTHGENGERPAYNSNRTCSKRLLVIDAVTPTPDKDAGSLVTVEMIRAFQKQGYQVSFVPEDNFAYLSDVTPALQKSGVEVFYWPFFKSIDEILEIEGDRFDAVLVYRVTCLHRHLDTIRKRVPDAKLIFHVADLHHLREMREAEIFNDAGKMKQARLVEVQELACVAGSDLTIVHSSVEKSILDEKVKDAEVYVFPWIERVTETEYPLSQRSGLTFIGGFRHPPNAQGVLWFVENVWPRVRQANPNAIFRLIGSEAPAEIEALNGQNGIKVLGWVPELEPHLARTRVSIAPLQYGAGVKGKVISSLAAGVPVVATSIASEGLDEAALDAMSVTDDPQEMADAIGALLRDDDQWARQSEAGKSFVQSHLSRERGVERVREIENLIQKARRPG